MGEEGRKPAKMAEGKNQRLVGINEEKPFLHRD